MFLTASIQSRVSVTLNREVVKGVGGGSNTTDLPFLLDLVDFIELT